MRRLCAAPEILATLPLLRGGVDVAEMLSLGATTPRRRSPQRTGGRSRLPAAWMFGAVVVLAHGLLSGTVLFALCKSGYSPAGKTGRRSRRNERVSERSTRKACAMSRSETSPSHVVIRRGSQVYRLCLGRSLPEKLPSEYRTARAEARVEIDGQREHVHQHPRAQQRDHDPDLEDHQHGRLHQDGDEAAPAASTMAAADLDGADRAREASPAWRGACRRRRPAWRGTPRARRPPPP